MKEKLRSMLKRIPVLLAGGAVIALGAGIGSYVVSLVTGGNPFDGIFTIGMLLVVAGILSSMKGGANTPFGQFGSGTQGNLPTSPYTAQGDRGSREYYKHFWENAVVELRYWPLMLLFGGALSILTAVLLG